MSASAITPAQHRAIEQACRAALAGMTASEIETYRRIRARQNAALLDGVLMDHGPRVAMAWR